MATFNFGSIRSSTSEGSGKPLGLGTRILMSLFFGAFLGAGLVAQILCAALIALLGWLLIRRLQPRRRKSSMQADPAVFFDVGSRVRVEHWQAGGTARVQYRGASWEAVIEHGAAQPPQPGDYVIRALDGNRLVLGLPD